MLVRPGLGAYLVLAQGRTAYCFTVPAAAGRDAADLARRSRSRPRSLPDAEVYDPAYTYPVYLDKWSDKGIGTWYTPYDPFDDDPKGMNDVVTRTSNI